MTAMLSKKWEMNINVKQDFGFYAFFDDKQCVQILHTSLLMITDLLTPYKIEEFFRFGHMLHTSLVMITYL